MRLRADRDSAVEVLHDGTWLPAALMRTYRRDDGRWRGIVRYRAGVGEQYGQSRDQDEIRAASKVRPRTATPPLPLT